MSPRSRPPFVVLVVCFMKEAIFSRFELPRRRTTDSASSFVLYSESVISELATLVSKLFQRSASPTLRRAGYYAAITLLKTPRDISGFCGRRARASIYAYIYIYIYICVCVCVCVRVLNLISLFMCVYMITCNHDRAEKQFVLLADSAQR